MGIFGYFKRNKNNPAVEERTDIVTDTVDEVSANEVQSQEQTAPVEENYTAEVNPVEDNGIAGVDAPAENGKVLVKIRYNRSFTAKLIQSEDKVKSYYGAIKNELLRYKVKTRTSWRYETFKCGRKLIARISFRGKTLGLYLALDPAVYAGTKYKIDDVSSVAKNAEVPLLFKIKNDLRCKYSKDLIAEAMSANGLVAGDAPADDYVARYPYEELDTLIERGLVKLLKSEYKGEGAEEALIEISEERYEQLTAETNYSEVALTEDDEPEYPEVVESISVVEAEEKIADDVVETFVLDSERYSDKTKKDIVNIDALGKYFEAGDDVTIEEIKKRVPSVNKKATYIKVLARGTLNKALNVEADDFSPAAIKMIVLTGGTVSRTKTRN